MRNFLFNLLFCVCKQTLNPIIVIQCSLMFSWKQLPVIIHLFVTKEFYIDERNILCPGLFLSCLISIIITGNSKKCWKVFHSHYNSHKVPSKTESEVIITHIEKASRQSGLSVFVHIVVFLFEQSVPIFSDGISLILT